MAPTPQTNIDLAGIAERFENIGSFVLCGHVSPDGDCVGSQLALAHALRSKGKSVVCLLARDEPLDGALRTLPGADEMVAAARFEGSAEAFVACDVPNPARLGDAAEVQKRCAVTFTIDHHASEAVMSQHTYVDPDAPATALIVWDLLKALGVEPSGAMASCAYAGLMTDTGGFCFQNTTAECFIAAAEMVGCGADPSSLARDLFQNRRVASLRLMQRMLDRAEFDEKNGIALSYVTSEDFERCEAVKADAEPLIDALRSVAGIRVAAMLREQNGEVRGSLRAKDETDVSAIARMFGGGGHVAAAGFTFSGTIEEAVVAVKEALGGALGVQREDS